jgi:hypothetical protein
MGRKTAKISRKLLAILTICTLITLMFPGFALAEDTAPDGTAVENGEMLPDETEDQEANGEDLGEDEAALDGEEDAVEDTDEEPADEEAEEEVDAPSEWAVPEIERAIENGLVTEKVLSNYQDDITREDFCELIVKLYEALSGEEAQLPEENIFTDTENEEILKANALGIVFGVSDTEFAPDANITREAIAVMFYRALEAVHPSLVAESFEVTFADVDNISEWALEAIGFMSNKGIIGGVGDNMVAPQGNATREQAIALVSRTYELFKDAEIEEPIVEEEVVEEKSVEEEPEEGQLEEDDENGEDETVE